MALHDKKQINYPSTMTFYLKHSQTLLKRSEWWIGAPLNFPKCSGNSDKSTYLFYHLLQTRSIGESANHPFICK